MPNVKVYADTPARRTRQVLADLFALFWCFLWIWLATKLYDLIMLIGKPGEAMESAGNGLRENLAQAGDKLSNVPLVGSQVRAPLDDAAQAADNLANAGINQQDAVGNLAIFLSICFAVMPIIIMLVIWLPLRIRFVRRATAAQRFIDAEADLDLFALRALAGQPMHVLAKVSDDPVGAWRRRDPEITRQLAALELKDSGLRPPPLPVQGS